MYQLTRGVYASLLLLIVACGVSKTAEELWQSSEHEVNAKKYQRAIKSLETLVTTYPESPLAPRAQFQIGDIYMNNMDDIPQSLTAYSKTTARYPTTDEGVKALFMVGFVNANHLEDYEAAKSAYIEFIHRYPNHELIPSVRFELDNLGRPVEEIEELKGI
ncbi:MAG: outer membrane protein assembly factor BamD, partial [Fidelibacterota bacterium]